MNWIDAFEANRAFAIVFGTVTSGVCLAVAIPTLWWVLPKHRRHIFAATMDPKMTLQLAYGLAAMAMAWADALCRYIPHQRLGLVHPAFLLTTAVLVTVLAPRILRAARGPARTSSLRNRLGLATVLVCAGAISLAALFGAFVPEAGA